MVDGGIPGIVADVDDVCYILLTVDIVSSGLAVDVGRYIAVIIQASVLMRLNGK